MKLSNISRQIRLKHTSVRLIIIVATIVCCICLAQVDRAFTTAARSIVYTGIAAGDTTETSAILWTRTAQASDLQGIVQPLILEVTTDRKFKKIDRTFTASTQAERDYTLKLEAEGLASGTHYYYRFRTPRGATSPIGRFSTAPKSQAAIPVKFGFSGDADGKWRPYPLAQAFSKLKLDFFIFIGDTIYETKSSISPAAADPAVDLPLALKDYHRKYRENLDPIAPTGLPSLQPLFAAQGNYTLLDNHELGNHQYSEGGAAAGANGKGVNGTAPSNDVNTSGTFINQTPGFKTLVRAYSDYQPIRERMISAPTDPRTDRTQQLYFAQRWGANAILINLDDRSYRDIRLKTATGKDDAGTRVDDPQRTMLGKTQLAWFEQTLRQSQADGVRWKIVAISSPIDEMGDDGGKSWAGGYRAERNRLLKFIADERIENVVFLSTDDHQYRVNELSYLPDLTKPNQRQLVPHCWTIIAGPLGAGGPEKLINRSFQTISVLANALAGFQRTKGLDPVGLDPHFPGLQQVFREGDPDADIHRQPVDFYSPDTFNYATLGISGDGRLLNVDLYGIHAYAPDTFPTLAQVEQVRRIQGFRVKVR